MSQPALPPAGKRYVVGVDMATGRDASAALLFIPATAAPRLLWSGTLERSL